MGKRTTALGGRLMARANLTAMLERLDPEPVAIPADSTPQAESTQAPSAAAQPDLAPAQTRATQAPGPASGGYLSFERKETRLRADQYAGLTQEARRLNKAKATGGERITENTLICIAIDLLFKRVEDLVSSTEGELRNSVTP
jgi:hypothetical protein